MPLSWKVVLGCEIAETDGSGAVALNIASVPGVGGDIEEHGGIGGSTWLWVTRELDSLGSKYSFGPYAASFEGTGGFGEGRGVRKSVFSSSTSTLLRRKDSSSRLNGSTGVDLSSSLVSILSNVLCE